MPPRVRSRVFNRLHLSYPPHHSISISPLAQYGCYDKASDGIFLTTSRGTCIHFDNRSNRVTFNQDLSAKKINCLSQHPTSTHTIAVGGLDRQVKLFDIRKFGNAGKKLSSKGSKPFATQTFNGSINSCFFSPSGSSLLTTSMADVLSILPDAHKLKGEVYEEAQLIPHNNQTGRFLSVFMARWHPTLDVFTVGCKKPQRQLEIFGEKKEGSGKFECKSRIVGDYVTTVHSRNAFHPSLNILAGGSSSGRVVVAGL